MYEDSSLTHTFLADLHFTIILMTLSLRLRIKLSNALTISQISLWNSLSLSLFRPKTPYIPKKGKTELYLLWLFEMFVDKLKAEPPDHITSQVKRLEDDQKKSSYPRNYQTRITFFHLLWPAVKVEKDTKSDTENPEGSKAPLKYAEEKTIENPTNKETKGSEEDFLPPNYVTCSELVKVVCKAMLVVTGPGYGGVTKILDEKKKHTWSLQVLDELLQSPKMYEHENPGQGPPRILVNESKKELILDVEEDGTKTEFPPLITKKDSPILIAAKHGITEIVKKILEKFPVAIHDTLENKKNIVLIAVENRQLEVYKFLLRKYSKNEGMFRKVDKAGNGALHFAATLTIEHPRWPIPGDALQMQWEIKWLKFVEESKPKHFFVRYNSEDKTPDEIFTKTHTELVKSGGEWMKKTAESCSLVAALIATVAFATSTALPGGVDDQSGKPHLETRPGFQVFAIASLIALCFSVTSLVMFLAILTSRYQEKDFGKNLPWKLLLGLTSLFVSIASILVSFCAGHFFVIEDTIRYAAFPVYAFTGVPVTFFAAAQFPLYFDLIRATFRSPFGDHAESSEDSEVCH
ncbi:hypothetical protein UlMin_031502 [Ulmus minor]